MKKRAGNYKSSFVIKFIKARRKNAFQCLCLLVAITFIFPFLGWAFESNLYHHIPALKIPSRLGSITSTFKGNGPMVVHVQDLHCNLEVQNNIAKLIHWLSQRHGLNLVAVEGAGQPINVGLLSSFPIDSVKKELAHYLMKQGRITGPEFYAATGTREIRLEGIETPELYRANLSSVGKFFSHESQGYICDLRALLEKIKGRVYHKRLRAFDKYRTDFREGRISLLKYSLALSRQAALFRENLKEFPLLEQYISQRTESFSDSLDSDELHNELVRLDQRLRAGLYTSPAQRELDLLGRRLDIIEKLLNISARPVELAEYRDIPEDFKVKRFLAFAARWDKAGEYQPGPEIFRLDSYIEEAKTFYQVADERSRAFVSNLFVRMRQQGDKIALLVTGGYHSAEVLSELRRRGISHICVKPRLRQHDLVNPYFALLRNQQSPLEKLLAQNQNILCLEPLWQVGDGKLNAKRLAFSAVVIQLLKMGGLAHAFRTGAQNLSGLREKYTAKIGTWADSYSNIHIVWNSVRVREEALWASFNTNKTVVFLSDKLNSRQIKAVKNASVIRLNMYGCRILAMRREAGEKLLERWPAAKRNSAGPIAPGIIAGAAIGMLGLSAAALAAGLLSWPTFGLVLAAAAGAGLLLFLLSGTQTRAGRGPELSGIGQLVLLLAITMYSREISWNTPDEGTETESVSDAAASPRLSQDDAKYIIQITGGDSRLNPLPEELRHELLTPEVINLCWQAGLHGVCEIPLAERKILADKIRTRVMEIEDLAELSKYPNVKWEWAIVSAGEKALNSRRPAHGDQKEQRPSFNKSDYKYITKALMLLLSRQEEYKAFNYHCDLSGFGDIARVIGHNPGAVDEIIASDLMQHILNNTADKHNLDLEELKKLFEKFINTVIAEAVRLRTEKPDSQPSSRRGYHRQTEHHAADSPAEPGGLDLEERHIIFAIDNIGQKAKWIHHRHLLNQITASGLAGKLARLIKTEEMVGAILKDSEIDNILGGFPNLESFLNDVIKVAQEISAREKIAHTHKPSLASHLFLFIPGGAFTSWESSLSLLEFSWPAALFFIALAVLLVPAGIFAARERRLPTLPEALGIIPSLPRRNTAAGRPGLLQTRNSHSSSSSFLGLLGSGNFNNIPYFIRIHLGWRNHPQLHKKLIYILSLGLRLLSNERAADDTARLAVRLRRNQAAQSRLTRIVAQNLLETNFLCRVSFDIVQNGRNNFLGGYTVDAHRQLEKILIPASAARIMTLFGTEQHGLLPRLRQSLALLLCKHIVKYQKWRYAARLLANEQASSVPENLSPSPALSVLAAKVLISLAEIRFLPQWLRGFLQQWARHTGPEIYFMRIIHNLNSSHPAPAKASAAKGFTNLKGAGECLDFLNSGAEIARIYRSLVHAATSSSRAKAGAALERRLRRMFPPPKTSRRFPGSV